MNFNAMNMKKMGIVNKIASLLAFFLVIVATTPANLPAQERPDAGSDWQYSVAPYVWFVSLEGEVTAKGQANDIDVGFSDIWDELNLGATIEFEAWKDRYGYFVSVMYGNVGDERTVDGIRIVPTIENFWAEIGGFYRLGTWDLNKDSTQKYPNVTVDSYLGLRYSYVEVELDFRNVPVADAKGDRDWFEPVLGLRTLWDLSDSWSLSLGGDIGGMAFGSDFAWNAFGLIGYRCTLFGIDNAQVFAGYRALSQDYEDGSGAKKFEWDVTLHGPVIGVSIPFGGKKAKASNRPD